MAVTNLCLPTFKLPSLLPLPPPPKFSSSSSSLPPLLLCTPPCFLPRPQHRPRKLVLHVTATPEGRPRSQEDQDSGSEEPSQWDVSRSCVQPVFRSAPIIRQDPSSYKKVNILFLSEGNVCRSVYAEAIFTSLIKEFGLQDVLDCTSKATKDYNKGEPPDIRAVQVAEELGIQLRKDTIARVFDCTRDVVVSDIILVMDKFNASDVMKEITVYETIDKKCQYSQKVRRLGQFCQARVIEDIDDPLYGNMGGPEELEMLHQVLVDIEDSCKGLFQYLLTIQSNLQGSESLKDGIACSLGQMGVADWLVPPMLQRA